jgi:hypothetical protein
VKHDRIGELIEYAEDNGITINPDSLEAVRLFVAKEPLIFLLDNGNFRVRWQFYDVSFGVELTGKDTANVVTFRR